MKNIMLFLGLLFSPICFGQEIYQAHNPLPDGEGTALVTIVLSLPGFEKTGPNVCMNVSEFSRTYNMNSKNGQIYIQQFSKFPYKYISADGIVFVCTPINK